MAERGCVVHHGFHFRGILLACIVCAVLIGTTGAVDFSPVERPTVQMHAYVSPTPTIFPCAAGYSCMLPAAAAEKGYTISGDARPCAYVTDSGQLTAEYCYRPPVSRDAIEMAKTVPSGGSPGPAVAARKPLAGLCAGEGMTSCPGWGCVDLQTNITNCGSCGTSCENFTGCRDGRCYSDLSMIGAVPKVADAEMGQVDQYSGMEHKALNPQPVPPLVPEEMGQADQYSGMVRKALNPQPVPPLVPGHAAGGSGTDNGFLSPILSFFAPAENAVPPTPAPVAAVSRNRGILESLFAIFSPVKDQPVTCSRDTDCPVHLVCGMDTCVQEYVVVKADRYTAVWGDTINFTGNSVSNPLTTVCMDVSGPGLPAEGWTIVSAVQPRGDTSFIYLWDTAQPLAPGFTPANGTYLVKTHLHDCTDTNPVQSLFSFTVRG